MVNGNYDKVSGVEVAEWIDDEPDPVEQRHCKVDEFYYDDYLGELHLNFEDRDTNRYFSVSIPIKATQDWNELVESLPTWDN